MSQSNPPAPSVPGSRTRPEFDTHQLNEAGLEKAKTIGDIFSDALSDLERLIPKSREHSLVVTKLQEAKHFAVRAVAMDPLNVLP
jgi:hypothetical protein